jgi:hypothetical protein
MNRPKETIQENRPRKPFKKSIQDGNTFLRQRRTMMRLLEKIFDEE